MFDQESHMTHSVTRGGITIVIWENLSMYLTKQDSACLQCNQYFLSNILPEWKEH
jgi:hypothetical protein